VKEYTKVCNNPKYVIYNNKSNNNMAKEFDNQSYNGGRVFATPAA
jgi:hypothetical protein